MCGIVLTIHAVTEGHAPGQDDIVNLRDSLILNNKRRGPDAQNTYIHRLKLNGSLIEVALSASVLGLRGDGVTAQPLVGTRGVLAWNGQVFDGIPIDASENDTRKIFARLEAGDTVSEVLSSIEGPYAFVYLDLQKDVIHFQSDPLVRRSLLTYPPSFTDDSTNTPYFVLSSTRSALAREMDVPMRALLGGEGGTIDLKRIAVLVNAEGQKFLNLSSAYSNATHLASTSNRPEYTCVTPINPDLPPEVVPPISPEHVTKFLEELGKSVKRRAENIPPRHNPSEARAAVLFSGGVDSVLLTYMLHLHLPPDEPIDLVNVAFQQVPSKHALRKPKGKICNGDGDVKSKGQYDVPDRIGGYEALEELRSIAQREWRFVEINVTNEEYLEHKQTVVDLLYPCSTEMDLSLAYPLYFASRGLGEVILPDGTRSPHTVKAKVYFTGLGPDEQLAGYSRHKQAFSYGSWKRLIKEVQMDVERLPSRNTSRDDRMISSFARDARLPYLDLAFIKYISELPIWGKCDPTIPGGDKLLLRLAAKSVGLVKTSGKVKRAMQFGSKSAKVDGAGRGPKAGARGIE